MDLNAKIAARRKEIEQEKEMAAQESALAQDIEWIKQVAMRQRGVNKDFDNRRFKKELERRARKKMEKDGLFIALIILMFLGFFIAWELGVALFVLLGLYVNICKVFVKRRILSEAITAAGNE